MLLNIKSPNLWCLLERSAVERPYPVVAEIHSLQLWQSVQRDLVQLNQFVVAQIKGLKADDVDETGLAELINLVPR